MKYPSFFLGAALIGIGSIASYADLALADTSSDFVFYDAQIQALHHRVDATATSPTANTEMVTALQGKQEELENQEAKMKAEGKITPDEKTALSLSIREQQQRLNGPIRAAAPAVHHVDPASQPAPTYVTPQGTTISGAAGTTPQQNGVIPLEGEAAPVVTMTPPTISGPTVPVIHAPQPMQPVTEMPAQQ